MTNNDNGYTDHNTFRSPLTAFLLGALVATLIAMWSGRHHQDELIQQDETIRNLERRLHDADGDLKICRYLLETNTKEEINKSKRVGK